ncbi:hypothetical protein V9T40_001971 [Parthenolecanium corni]|uniref:WH1 domain-containing protein n=1 Tax=Parthenolecanium corni TaxID=536013 RepID=A0AAN9Y549_9HEMI
MIYDDANKRWIPSGSSSGVSKVHIFQHNFQNSFRVVGRKLQDHEVVINCIIARSLKYNQATPTFHQWRDSKQVYGLNFSSKEDADAFAKAMNLAVETITNTKPACQPPAVPVNTNANPANVMMNGQQVMPQTNGQYDEDMGYRTMTKEDMVALQERRMSQQSQILSSPGSVSTVSAVSVSPQGVPGHQRTSSAPPAPQPPPLLLSTPPAQPPQPPPQFQQQQQLQLQQLQLLQQQQQQLQQQQLQQPLIQSSAPPLPAAAPAAPAPPCPPPLPSNNLLKSGESAEIGSLAAQLQTCRLRRSNRQSAENSGSSTSSGGSSNYGTLGRVQGGGMASMMDEMAKTLARRRAAVEKKDTESAPEETTPNEKKSWNSRNSNSNISNNSSNNNSATNGCESPKPVRKQFMTSSEELTNKVNGEVTSLSSDLENLKQEILREVQKELAQMKREIIDVIKAEFGRR